MSQLEGCPKGPIGLEGRGPRKVDLAFHKATLTEGTSGSDSNSNRRSGVGEGFAVHLWSSAPRPSWPCCQSNVIACNDGATRRTNMGPTTLNATATQALASSNATMATNVGAMSTTCNVDAMQRRWCVACQRTEGNDGQQCVEQQAIDCNVGAMQGTQPMVRCCINATMPFNSTDSVSVRLGEAIAVMD